MPTTDSNGRKRNTIVAKAANFPGREDVPGRLGFIGHEASDEIKALYVDKRVPDEYQKKGAANPIKYSWKV